MTTNVLDYIKWRGDLSFKNDPFNEIDALIFARFAYMDLADIKDNTTIQSAYDIYLSNIDMRKKCWETDPELFKMMANSNRYASLLLKKYICVIDKEEVEQFFSC